MLVADADTSELMQINALLEARYEVKLANGGAQALRMLEQQPDVLLLAAAMPEPDGLQLCARVCADPATAALPVLVLCTDAAQRSAALQAGAADTLDLPLDPDSLQQRVATQLELAQARRLLAERALQLETLVAARTEELSRMRDATILALANLAESRNHDTVNHLRRTQHYVVALARHLQQHPRFARELDEDTIGLLFRAAPLHDIGQVGVPDAILLKPGALTPEEFAQMKMHTVYGRDAIREVESCMGGSNAFLRHAADIAYSHQEKWDGSGYPQGLAGEAIPLSARLMAVADVYDALVSRRIYRPAFTHETAVEMVRQGRGEHFDPDIVDAMLAIEETFMQIAAQYRDPE
ncbi:HD domain-containing phosphohydrolase [Massilia sp. TS11]|uniref:HD-GYP domain-containing protein n=1 Tax=Massilia sp. TS11 TaxID=2908003 RepID=UPI001EDA6F4A|nr:HD domain-containing protein [Massilia sp. TS11]